MYSLVHLLLADIFGYTYGLILLGIADGMAVLSVPSVLMRRRGRPMAAMSWLLALFVLPYLGVLGWWLFGRIRVHRKERLRRESTEEFRECVDWAAWREPSREAFEVFGKLLPAGTFEHYDMLQLMGPTRGNRLELRVDGEQGYSAIEQMIERADEYIHLLFYIWQDDATGRRIRDRLVDKARQGVTVRVLVDGFGSPNFERRLAGPLREAGGSVATFLPPRFFVWRPTFNFRNHRKLIVVDGREALTGGMNIGREYEHDWHDLGVRLQGPVVQHLHSVWMDDWLFATDENLASREYLDGPANRDDEAGRDDEVDEACAVIASGPDSDQPVLKDSVVHVVNGAEERLWMMTPYFIPSGDLLAGLRAAVQRGVDVRLMLPERGDLPIVQRASRTYYPRLLDSGVKLFEYRPSILHGKAAVVDSQYAIVGSANLDVRSFEINFELTTVTASRPLNQHLSRVFEKDFEECRRVTPEQLDQQRWLSKLADSVAHLTSPQL